MLCADDYGMSAGISRGIVELAGDGRISATSAMSLAPGWAELSRDLAPLAGRIGIGLHLTLTWGRPLGPMPVLAPDRQLPSVGRLVRLALAGRLPGAEIEAEIDRQLDRFEAALGRAPDFVDGHQHVHALPGIRSALLQILTRRSLTGRLWLRDPSDRPSAILRRGVSAGKAAIVAALGAGFGKQARRAGFRTNEGFSGFSAFDPNSDLTRDFRSYLSSPGPAHLVMCHPGRLAPGEKLDGVVEARGRELAFLASDTFSELLAKRGVTLVSAPAEQLGEC